MGILNNNKIKNKILLKI